MEFLESAFSRYRIKKKRNDRTCQLKNLIFLNLKKKWDIFKLGRLNEELIEKWF